MCETDSYHRVKDWRKVDGACRWQEGLDIADRGIYRGQGGGRLCVHHRHKFGLLQVCQSTLPAHKRVLFTDHADKKDRRTHIQHVTATHNLLRNFIKKYFVVSSKYLTNYLVGFAYMGDYEKSSDRIAALVKDVVCSRALLAHYKKLKLAILNWTITQ